MAATPFIKVAMTHQYDPASRRSDPGRTSDYLGLADHLSTTVLHMRTYSIRARAREKTYRELL